MNSEVINCVKSFCLKTQSFFYYIHCTPVENALLATKAEKCVSGTLFCRHTTTKFNTIIN